MKGAPRWLLWAGLTFTVWVAAAWLIWGVLDPREAALRGEKESLKRQKAEAEGLVAAAPRVIAQIDSVKTLIHEQMAQLTTTDEIPRLLTELREDGWRRRLDDVRAELELQSTMNIPFEGEPKVGGTVAIHPLRVTMGVLGTFDAIGAWLDAVEDRADFQQWIECRWAEKTEVGRISFSGEAEFWVITPAVVDSMTAEDLGG